MWSDTVKEKKKKEEEGGDEEGEGDETLERAWNIVLSS